MLGSSSMYQESTVHTKQRIVFIVLETFAARRPPTSYATRTTAHCSQRATARSPAGLQPRAQPCSCPSRHVARRSGRRTTRCAAGLTSLNAVVLTACWACGARYACRTLCRWSPGCQPCIACNPHLPRHQRPVLCCRCCAASPSAQPADPLPPAGPLPCSQEDAGAYAQEDDGEGGDVKFVKKGGFRRRAASGSAPSLAPAESAEEAALESVRSSLSQADLQASGRPPRNTRSQRLLLRACSAAACTTCLRPC